MQEIWFTVENIVVVDKAKQGELQCRPFTRFKLRILWWYHNITWTNMNKLTKEQRYSESRTSRILDLQDNCIAFYHLHQSIVIEHRTDLVFTHHRPKSDWQPGLQSSTTSQLAICGSPRKTIPWHSHRRSKWIGRCGWDRSLISSRFDGRNCFGNPRRVSDLAVDRCVVRILEKLCLKVGRMR